MSGFTPYRLERGGIGRFLKGATCSPDQHELLRHVLPRRRGVLIWPALVDRERVYLWRGVVTERPVLFETTRFELVADGVAELALSFPAGTIVRFEGQVETTTEFVLATAFAGTRELHIEPPFPLRKQTLTVVAHAD